MPAIRHPDHGPHGPRPDDQFPDDRMLMQRKFSQFLASVAPVALGCSAGLFAAVPAFADTTISTGSTQTLATSTAGNVTVSSTGTLTGTSGAAVTVNSSNTVTVNGGGTIYAGTASTATSGAIGIQVNPGNTTTITNGGTIAVLENFTPSINGGYVTGPVSAVSGRYGIYGAPGGTITGNVSNTAAVTTNNVTTTGTIVVDGEQSAGIQLDSALTGNFSNQGNITVLGDKSYGVKLAGVTGNVTVGGVLTVTGSAAQGYVQAGSVTGVVLLDGSISNGYTYTATNGQSLILDRPLLNTGPLTGTTYLSVGTAPVVEIDGNVTGGVLINSPTSSTSTDTNRGSITAYGNNPALQIGGASNIVIGANANTDNGSLNANTNSGSFALGIDGAVTANSYYSSTAAYGVVVGGRGGTVTLTGGLEVYGTVTASTIDTAATAILINQGANVSTIFNSGSIKSSASEPSVGNVYAIQDLSGTVTTLTNQGFISASGKTNGTPTAIDLSHNTSGVTLTQNYSVTNQTNEKTDVSTTGYNPLTATLYAGITGDILLGSGTNTMTITSGGISGNTYFAGGSTNTVTAGDVTRWVGNINVGSSAGAGALAMTLNNYAQFNGTLNLFNSTGSLTLNNNASFLGTINQGGNFDVAINGGTFGTNAVTTSAVRNLTVASGAALRVFVDGTTGTSSQLVTNSATFASGAKISLAVNSLSNIVGNYDVLTATTLTGASALTSSSLNLPVLFNGSVTTDAHNVYVNIARATATQLGLTSGQTAAYAAILNDAAANTAIQNTLLGIYDTPTLRNRFNELLPNYSGGTFDIVSRATRIADAHYTDDTTMFSISDSAAWIEPIVFRGTRTFGDTPGFKTTGGGLSLGAEKVTPVGNLGFQLAFLTGNASTSTINQNLVAATAQTVKASAVELGLFWRKSSGPLYVWAGGNLGRESFNSSRTFYGSYTNTTSSSVSTVNFTNAAAGHWAGWSAAFNAGVSYTLPIGEHFSLRPRGLVEYDYLKENRYIETGDNAIALTVAGRNSSQTTATTTLMAQWSAGPSNHEGRPFAINVEAGRRSALSGNLGQTTATFETGDTFTLNGGRLPSAWVSNISILQGGLDYTWKISTDIERGSDKGVAYGVRASISIAL